MNNQLISIIIPVFNIDLYIANCIDSLINQTYSNIEILIIDDGSTDNSPQICDEFGHKDSRVKVIHKQNGGLVSARNAGYEAAKGDWIMYIDGDDGIDFNTCEDLIQYANKYNPEIIFWNNIYELNEYSIKGKFEWKCKESERLYETSECADLAYNVLIYKSGIATAYCKLLRKDFVDKNKLWHNKKLKQGAEGTEFSLRVFNNATKALYIKEYYYHYRYNDNSISKKVDETNTQCLIDCLQEMNNYISGMNNPEHYRLALYQRSLYVLIAIALSTYFHKDNKDSLRTKITKYNTIIKENDIFSKALTMINFSSFDKFRMFTLYFIKLKLYFLLPIISNTKQYYMKRGKYSY